MRQRNDILDRAKAFYDQALRPLGIQRLYAEGHTAAGYGSNGKACFRIGLRNTPQTGAHVAFATPDPVVVDAFHAAALAADGAFVLDPDGHNIEAVCRTPPSEVSVVT